MGDGSREGRPDDPLGGLLKLEAPNASRVLARDRDGAAIEIVGAGLIA